MWKKVIPVAAVLILAWIGLNLMTAKDAEESVAHAPDATTSEVTESAGDEAEAVNLAENTAADTTPETATADEEPAEVADAAPAEEAPAADTAASEVTTDDAETAAETDDETTADTEATVEAATDDAETAAETDVEATADTEATAEAATDDAETAAETDVETTAETESTAEAATDGAETAADTTAEPESTTEVADTEATEADEAVSSTDEETAESSEVAADATEMAADASDSTVAMRYPTDPVTGASIYDQGMIEVVIEPSDEPVEEETETASEQSSDASETVTEEVAATEPEEVVEPVIVTRKAMRYPTDPETGATIYDQGMVEVEFESEVEPGEEVVDGSSDQVAEASDASDAVETGSNTQMRYPTDPVTGATLYDQGMVEVVIESDAEEEEVAESASDQAPETAETAAGVQMRYPTDPVTGATLYDQGMVEVVIESDAEVEEVAESTADQAPETAETATGVQMRYPTDPVTGATLYDQGMVEVGTETAEVEAAGEDTETASDETAQATDAGPAPDATAEVSATETEAVTTTTTGAAATIAERGTFSLSAISRSLGSVFGTTTTVLSAARDEASAKAVLPRLEAASRSLAEVSDQYVTLPEYAKGPLGKVIKRGMSRLKPLADTALTREGVGSVLMPVMGPMLETMQGMLR